jgi:hypothetical protein
MERAVGQHHATTVTVPPDVRDLVRARLDTAVTNYSEISADVRDACQQKLVSCT